MNPPTDNERLLTDVLAPEADPGFSDAVLAATLRGVRRQRHVRRIRRLGGAVMVVLMIGLSSRLVLREETKRTAVQPLPSRNYQLIISQPLPATQIVSTTALRPDQSVSLASIVTLVQTAPGGYAEIGDDELISLAAPRVVALVRRGPHRAELIFVSSSPEHSDSEPN